MATRKIVDCKDLSTGNKVYPKTHASAVVMDDGRALQDTLDDISSSISSETYVINVNSSTVYSDLQTIWDSGVRCFIVYSDDYKPATMSYSNEEFTVNASLVEGDQTSGFTLNKVKYSITSSAVTVDEQNIPLTDYITYPLVNHGTSDTTLELAPNTLHVWDTVSSLTLTLGASAEDRASEYIFKFDSGSAATTLSLPSSLKWNGGEAPTIEANKTYQISILNGLAVCVEFE